MPTSPPIGIGIIYCVKFTDGRIDKLGVQDLWSQTPRCMTRAEVIHDIRRGSQFQTAYQQKDGTWCIGARVHIVDADDGPYLRTDADSTPADNLGQLAECTDC